MYGFQQVRYNVRVLWQVRAQPLHCQWLAGIDAGRKEHIDVDLDLVFLLSAESLGCLWQEHGV